MIFKIILSYFSGYINLIIEGYYIERFINLCKIENISIWNIKRKDGIKLVFNCGIKDYRKICKIASKIKCKIHINNKKGVPFILNRYRKRKIFLILLILLVILLIISTQFVWNVEIIEESGLELENIEQDLEKIGLNEGILKKDIDTQEIISEIRLIRNDIAWIGIEITGTSASVKIVKAQEKPDIIDEDEYCNIVSQKSGIITKISAQAGTLNVAVGDSVNEGDILVNGWMEGKYTGIRYVHAVADIEAKVWYTKQINVPYNFIKKEETGNIEEYNSIKINNFEINFNKRVSKFEIYDTMVLENQLHLFSDFYLPIFTTITTNKEIVETEIIYQKDEAISYGINKLEEEFEKEITNKEDIVNKNVNTIENVNSIDVYLTYEVIEDIGTNEKILF